MSCEKLAPACLPGQRASSTKQSEGGGEKSRKSAGTVFVRAISLKFRSLGGNAANIKWNRYISRPLTEELKLQIKLEHRLKAARTSRKFIRLEVGRWRCCSRAVLSPHSHSPRLFASNSPSLSLCLPIFAF